MKLAGIKTNFRIWYPEMLLTVLSATLLAIFYFGYAEIYDGQSAMVPAAGITIFWALLKFTVFSTFGHIVTFVYCSRYARAARLKQEKQFDPEYIEVTNSCDRTTQLIVWLGSVFCMSVCSLA